MTTTFQAWEDDESRFNPIHPAAKATVTITVDDIDDNPPIFTSQNFVGHVFEHEEIGHKVATVKAIDKDEVFHSQISYKTYLFWNSCFEPLKK